MSIHLPNKSGYNSLVIKDLEWQHRVASLKREFLMLEPPDKFYQKCKEQIFSAVVIEHERKPGQEYNRIGGSDLPCQGNRSDHTWGKL